MPADMGSGTTGIFRGGEGGVSYISLAYTSFHHVFLIVVFGKLKCLSFTLIFQLFFLAQSMQEFLYLWITMDDMHNYGDLR